MTSLTILLAKVPVDGTTAVPGKRRRRVGQGTRKVRGAKKIANIPLPEPSNAVLSATVPELSNAVLSATVGAFTSVFNIAKRMMDFSTPGAAAAVSTTAAFTNTTTNTATTSTSSSSNSSTATGTATIATATIATFATATIATTTTVNNGGSSSIVGTSTTSTSTGTENCTSAGPNTITTPELRSLHSTEYEALWLPILDAILLSQVRLKRTLTNPENLSHMTELFLELTKTVVDCMVHYVPVSVIIYHVLGDSRDPRLFGEVRVGCYSRGTRVLEPSGVRRY